MAKADSQHSETGSDSDIVFREIRRDGVAVYWYVEAYDESKLFPVGTAYVVVVGNSVQLNFINVAKQWQRRGHGAALVAAIRNRWPNFVSTGPMDESSEAFAKATGLSPD